MWIASLPLWFVSAMCGLMGLAMMAKATVLACNNSKDNEEIGQKVWVSLALLVMCSLVAALAVLIWRL